MLSGNPSKGKSATDDRRDLKGSRASLNDVRLPSINTTPTDDHPAATDPQRQKAGVSSLPAPAQTGETFPILP
jgi:hypothetical protein